MPVGILWYATSAGAIVLGLVPGADTDNRSYTLGIADTAMGEAGWYGEVCLTAGCHEGLKTLDSKLVVVEDTAEVVVGATTWFSESRAAAATFYVADADGDCAVWKLGGESSYYDPLGCYISPN